MDNPINGTVRDETVWNPTLEGGRSIRGIYQSRRSGRRFIISNVASDYLTGQSVIVIISTDTGSVFALPGLDFKENFERVN